MVSQNQSSTFKIRDSVQADVFSHPVRARILFACANGERSLAQLQRRSGLTFSRLHYHVTKLVALGLLTISRIEPRAGRPVRFYRAVSRAFLVPQAILRESMGDLLSKELRRSLTDLSRRRDLSMLYSVDEAGKTTLKVINSSARPARTRAQEFWKLVRLSAPQRESLARDIAALIAHYDSVSDGPGMEYYLIHAAFAPKLAR